MDMNISSEEETKLYNKAYIIQKYDEIRNSTETHALISINIKNFRYYNTKYGAEAGDEILRLLLQKLTALMGEGEYAAHLYSDNFALLVRYDDVNRLVYERLMFLLDNTYRIPDSRIHRDLFLSMGIFQLEDRNMAFEDAWNFSNLSRKESETLFRRSSCMEVYDETYYNHYMDRMHLETKTANAYKNYEFVTYLQPKVDLKTERIIGMEALLRWFDKDGNSIPLNKFLPILDENGYISLIDMDTFEQICQYLENRLKNHKKVVPVSFNLSKAHFYDTNLIQDYIKVFEKFEIPKDLIEIELMESISMNDTEQMKKVISQFKEYGFTCSLDDFGNGYSSFNVLLNAQLDIVKMDRQFFLNNLNGESELVIKNVVDLIHSLNMKVVAEGVESSAHIAYLKACGCDYVQGYYYYKPMALDDINVLLDAQE